MFLRATFIVALLLSIVIVCSSVNADSWAPPRKRNYYSADKKYCLEVIPKLLGDQIKYLQDKVNRGRDASAADALKNNYARAIFYVNENTGYRNTGANTGYTKKSEFPLVNDISPVEALVSADGNYVVTFDNWHRVGIGDDVVVIYRSDGTLIKKFSLEDIFTTADIQGFLKTASSRWWGHGHYLDEKKNIVHLKPYVYGPLREFSIDLASGQLLQPKSDPPR